MRLETYNSALKPPYTLIIAEKAKAASKIAYALSNGRFQVFKFEKIPYWVFYRGNGKYIVVPAAGHMFGLKSVEAGFPTFKYEWRPLWEVDKKAKHIKKYYQLLEKLCLNATYYVNACDYDIEGSVIGYMIIRFLGDVKRASRMKFSSLTPEELRSSFANMSKGLDWEMVEAGICRHELDWIWGINTSRALMYALRKITRKNIILSAGRVQSPTLVNVVEKEVERETHVPKVNFSLKVQVEIGDKKYYLEFQGGKFKKIGDAKKALEEVKKHRYAVVSDVMSSKHRERPPPPFNLGDLQAEAYRIYGISPYETQKLAEELYLEATISYPRTNSQKLPPTLNYHALLQKIKEQVEYCDLVNMLYFETEGKLEPRMGVKTDPAHPAIYPTGIAPKKISGRKKAIYDLIVRRFLSCFSTDLILEKNVIKFNIGKLGFRLQTVSVEDYGWTKYYPFQRPKEEAAPKLSRGDKIEILKAEIVKSLTPPPRRYSKTDVLKWMERVNIGTEATRARIIETLFSRGYLELVKNNIVVTRLGYSISEALKEYFSELTSVKLTRKFEEDLEKVRRGERSRRVVVEEAKNHISKVLENFRAYADKVGMKIAKSLEVLRPEKPCKICGRESSNTNLLLCNYHSLAYENILKSYKIWVESLEDISFERYLKELIKTKNAGSWVREVAKLILEGGLKPKI